MHFYCLLLSFVEWEHLWIFLPYAGSLSRRPHLLFLNFSCAQKLFPGCFSRLNVIFFSGIKISRHAPSISHLMFADDLMVFSEARAEDAAVIQFCLHTCSCWFRQLINFSKSGVFFSRNTAPSCITEICHELGLRKADLGGKYLGLPLSIPRSRKEAFKEIQERVLSRLEGQILIPS